MKDVKRTVLWVLVGFCMISVVMGIFNQFAFLQIVTTDISSLSTAGGKEENFFAISTISSIVCTLLGVAFVFVAFKKFLKDEKTGNLKCVFGFLIAALAISLIFIVYSFLTLTILKAGSDALETCTGDGYLYYSAFVHYQTYLSATLSTFIPLFISAGLILGNAVCRIKFQKPEVAENAEPENK